MAFMWCCMFPPFSFESLSFKNIVIDIDSLIRDKLNHYF